MRTFRQSIRWFISASGRFTGSPLRLSVPALAAGNGGFVRTAWVDDCWRLLFAAGYFTGLRKSDLFDLRWREIGKDRIRRTMIKTRDEIEIPIHPILRIHFDRMPRVDDFVFGRPKDSHKQFGRELGRLCKAARTGPVLLQSIRRLSAHEWETARPRAGSAILGHRIRGADANYLDGFLILRSALPALAVPEAMGKEPIRKTARPHVAAPADEFGESIIVGAGL